MGDWVHQPLSEMVYRPMSNSLVRRGYADLVARLTCKNGISLYRNIVTICRGYAPIPLKVLGILNFLAKHEFARTR